MVAATTRASLSRAACDDEAVRTLIVSDLHLGAGTDVDLLRRPSARDMLLEELDGVDRLILLGDVVELRERPLGEAFELAGPFFRAVAEAAPDAELVLVPGNHDHHVLEDWLAMRRLDRAAPLELDQRAPDDCEGPLVGLARKAGNANVSLAYPGVWVRDDVYATHGHYLDRHLTIPTFERLALAAVERALGPPPDASEDPLDAPEGPTDPDEYERALTPVYAFLFALAQGASAGRRGPGPSARLWGAMSRGATRAQRLRGWVLESVALPSAVGVANRFGLGPVKPDLSPGAITQAGLTAMGEVIDRLGIEADHVIFGHTHRRGPLSGEPGWTAPGGAALLNTGSWTYMPGFIGSATAPESPYWPGTVVEVGETGAPEARLLLESLTRAELAEAAGAEPA
jgi:predicted phosphodiesterase